MIFNAFFNINGMFMFPIKRKEKKDPLIYSLIFFNQSSFFIIKKEVNLAESHSPFQSLISN